MRTGGEVAQWARVLAALGNDLSSVPSIYIRQLTTSSVGTCRHVAYTNTDIHIHISKNKTLFLNIEMYVIVGEIDLFLWLLDRN